MSASYGDITFYDYGVDIFYSDLSMEETEYGAHIKQLVGLAVSPVDNFRVPHLSGSSIA